MLLSQKPILVSFKIGKKSNKKKFIMRQLMISTSRKNKLISKKRTINMFKRVYTKKDHQNKFKFKKAMLMKKYRTKFN
jgi:DNA polymerase IIIc chi subunit